VKQIIDNPGGVSAEDVRAMLQSERTQVLNLVQQSVSQQMKMYSDNLQNEIANMVNNFNKISASYEQRVAGLSSSYGERFGRLEGDRAARGTFCENLRQDVNSQIEKMDKAIAQLRNDQRIAFDKIAAQGDDIQLESRTLRSQINKAIQELSCEFSGKLQAVVGNNFVNSIDDRIQRLVRRSFAELDITDLKQALDFERQARVGLTEALDGYRASYLQSFTDLRLELSRCSLGESGQNRLALVERTLAEVKTAVTSRTSGVETREFAILQDSQDFSRQVKDLSQSLDSYRNAHIQTSAELSSRIDWALDKLARLESLTSTSKIAIFDR
jgi:hypothetical protein